MKGQLLSADLLIGILAAISVFSIGVSFFDSIATRQVHSNNVIDASNLILETKQAPANTCYTQTLLDETEIENGDTCAAAFNANNCKAIYTVKRFTLVNLTQTSCDSGCILMVKTCAG